MTANNNKKRKPKKPKGPTDANDLHLEKGLQEVKRQITAALQNAAVISDAPPRDSPSPSYESVPPDYIYSGDYIPYDESPPPSVDECGGDLADMGRYSQKELLQHFWYVWGTDTCWDNISKKQIRLSHLRHGVGRERYKAWDESLARRCVRDICFEPGRDMGRHVVNLYEGIKMQPDGRGEAGCRLILQHLSRLCGFREVEFEWLVRWIAYPLQNPGAKMESSVIMYGSEGPGKSIIWEEVVKKIYGEYAVTIGQAQLESQFTGWRSKRLFALAEEVVSRAERNHHKGQLKQLVTGATSMINEKMLPEREESNHINFVFLSNSTVPLELDMGDRRYMVLYVDKKPDKQYFTDLFDEINSGGIECFYQYLLSIDMKTFTPYTEPPVNEEKEGLIDASLSSPLYFHKLWKHGELDLPYKSAIAGDVYAAFQRWCEKNGEFKRHNRYFGSELKRVMPQQIHSIKYPLEMASHKSQRIYITEDDLRYAHDKHFAERLGQSCRDFKEFLDKGGAM